MVKFARSTRSFRVSSVPGPAARAETQLLMPEGLICRALPLLLLGGLFLPAASFKLVIDLNTFNESELSFAAETFRVDDGTWSITVNSPGASRATWASALADIGPNAYSEDNPGSVSECALVRNLKGGTLLASFQYHETGGDPHTMLTWDEIGKASAACGNCGIIILTRAFWPNSEWRSNVEAVLSHPLLYAIPFRGNAHAPERSLFAARTRKFAGTASRWSSTRMTTASAMRS